MGTAKAELLRAAGINSISQLTRSNPARLTETLVQLNNGAKTRKIVLRDQDVEKMIEAAKRVQPRVTQ
jgi:nucleotidyltransferase/DNA polymerase involved in DNA repair